MLSNDSLINEIATVTEKKQLQLKMVTDLFLQEMVRLTLVWMIANVQLVHVRFGDILVNKALSTIVHLNETDFHLDHMCQ